MTCTMASLHLQSSRLAADSGMHRLSYAQTCQQTCSAGMLLLGATFHSSAGDEDDVSETEHNGPAKRPRITRGDLIGPDSAALRLEIGICSAQHGAEEVLEVSLHALCKSLRTHRDECPPVFCGQSMCSKSILGAAHMDAEIAALIVQRARWSELCSCFACALVCLLQANDGVMRHCISISSTLPACSACLTSRVLCNRMHMLRVCQSLSQPVTSGPASKRVTLY